MSKIKNLLIIYPHWHPANLAGVHRPRLIGNYLKGLGWKPYVLTVEQKYFEETPDCDFYKTFSDDFEIYRVKAFKISKPRIIGDIGLRSYFQMKKKALELIPKLKIDFIWIPIPSFYSALLGSVLLKKTGIPFGIDYIDPWVRDISKNPDIRARLSIWIAKKLEPIAIKKASLITGVSYEYYKPVLDRNFKDITVTSISNINDSPAYESSGKNIIHAPFPYGFDPNDHKIKLDELKLPWDDLPGCKPILYAGAFLPNSATYINLIFKVIGRLKKEKKISSDIKLFFIGTGHYKQKSILDYAKDNEIDEIVVEIRDRFPFLQVLNFLSAAYRILVLGTTEKHYTASKIFQSILSKQPIMAIFHNESTVNDILKETAADQFLIKYTPGVDKVEMEKQIEEIFLAYIKEDFFWKPDYKALDKYSAREGAKTLVEMMEKIIQK